LVWPGSALSAAGRVGRSNRLAYAYFTFNRDKVLTEQAEKRLRALQEFTEFGSGFKLALRDLEIRGAGNILVQNSTAIWLLLALTCTTNCYRKL